MKNLFFLTFLTLNAYADTQPTDCGVYEIYGQVKKNSGEASLSFIVNSGSMSEYKFALTSEQERVALPYLDMASKATAKIEKKMTGYSGALSTIEKFDYVVPDPANMTGKNGFFLIKKEACK